MELNNTLLSNVKLDALPARVSSILSQLQQAGLFRALVVQSQGNRVVLDTAYGKLTGKAPQNLKAGDEIMARLLPGKTDPTIKIEQHQPRQINLNARVLGDLVNNQSASLQLARVVTQTKQHTVLQVGQRSHSIPRQNLLQVGEALLLKALPKQQVEVIRIQPEAILKNALTKLLPQNQAQQSNSGLSAVQQLATNVLKLSPQNLEQLAKVLTEQVNTRPNVAKAATPNAYLSTSHSAKTLNTEQLQQLLANVAKPLARVDSIKPQVIQQLLSVLSLVKPLAPTHSESTAQALPQQLQVLQQALHQSPDSFQQLVRHIVMTNAGANKPAVSENLLLDVSNNYRAELLQQVEQTLTQLLTQKTSVRLQLEQNHPLQFNLNVPLQVDNEVKTLKLKVREKQRNEVEDEQHWEINLQFEFGLLGLISTHILLQGNRLSAHFWAVKSSTKSLIDSQLHSFKGQLEKSGFELGLFDCFIGQPASSQADNAPAHNDNLLDIKV